MSLNPPYGGRLVDRLLPEADADALKRGIGDEPSWDLSHRQLCDLELLLTGALSPLTGFMGQRDYERCLGEMRLADGTLWPVPVTLDVTEAFAEAAGAAERIALRDAEGVLIAVLEGPEFWRPDLAQEAQQLYGTADAGHPGVARLLERTHPVYVGGTVVGCALPTHYDFRPLRETPAQLRARLQARGWSRVVGFHTTSITHQAHHAAALEALQQAEANLLIHGVVGAGGDHEADRFTRVRCYEHLLERYPDHSAALSLLPLAPRLAGPREALWHAIIRKNYGCSHVAVGPHHASPPGPAAEFYDAGAAQGLLAAHAREIGIEPVAVEEMVYVAERAEYVPVSQVTPHQTPLRMDHREFQRRLVENLEIPEWYSFPEILDEVRQAWPPRHEQGVTVFFTGLSGAGKSSVANALQVKLRELGKRRVTLLDGDIVRKNLSSELGFSREHRDLNILRIGFVASEITKHGGIAICAPIAPYRTTRRKVRETIEAVGGFVEVYVSTPLEVCETRDRKGLYARARKGLIPGFTGVSDPYEEPEAPELVLDTGDCSPDEAAHRVLLKLESLGYIR